MTPRRSPGRRVRPLARRVLDTGMPRLVGSRGLVEADADGWPLPPRQLRPDLRARAWRVLRDLRRGRLTLARQDLRRLMRRPRLWRLPVANPPAHFWRWPAWLREEAALLAWHLVARRAWQDRGESRGLAASAARAAHPGSLGRPEVCGALATELVNAVIAWLRRSSDQQALIAETSRLARILGGADPAHPPVGAWSSREGVGAALVRACGLDPDYARDEDLDYVLSEASAALGIRLRQLHAAARDAADFEARAGAVRDFLADVLLGTHEVTHPGRRLGDIG